ncbi:MAG: RHS repeat-associated core domain-containing protein, partial [Byssovorax sp.]
LVFERDLLGRETQRSTRDGRISICSDYDSGDRLIDQRVSTPVPGDGLPEILVQRRWQYDRAGRTTRIDDARWGATHYVYDKRDLLLEARNDNLREVFAYDSAGSLVRTLEGLGAPADAAGKGDWKMAPGNVLVQTSRAKYAHDKRSRRTSNRDLFSEDVLRYSWDVRDRLREVTMADGTRVSMTYDAFGRRVRKEIFTPSSVPLRSVEFLWDGYVIAADIDTQHGSRCFVHRPGTLEPMVQAERGEVFLYVNDHLGMPKELLSVGGRVAWSASHTAWGRVTKDKRAMTGAIGGRSIASPFRLLGQYSDEETGLCSTLFRYFDPDTGRWLSPDPLGIFGGKNLFEFGSSPTVTVDPLGMVPDVFRGGYSLDVHKGEYKPRKEAGDLTGRGISTWNTPEKVEKFGGAFKVVSVPDSLEVAQRGNNKDHYEIIAKKPGMTEEEYKNAVKEVKLEKVHTPGGK